jgi:hypothetical protein
MDKKMKKHILISAGLVVVTIIAVVFSIYQTKKLENEYVLPKEQPQVAFERIKRRPPPVISRPEDYGMVVTDNNAPVLTEGYWNEMISKKVSQLKSNTPKEVLGKLNQKIKEDPAKTKEKMKLIDENIKNFNALLAKEPNNLEAQKRLKHFLMLKSLAKELPINE